MKRKFLITGVAGFIGFHLCKSLLKNGEEVIGVDNLNSYYDIKLKKARLRELDNIKIKDKNKFKFFLGDIENINFLDNLFSKYKPSIVINLAAQAGVRYSIENPQAYINSNLVGFGNILECCRKIKVSHLLYASSSSVYGGNKKIPFSEKDPVDHPVSLYAATKKANELMAHSYSHLYEIPTTGIRFFTVYGPWGRPDMAPMIFTHSIISRKPLKIFNKGDMSRDFTFIDDAVESVIRLIDKPPNKKEINILNNNHNRDFLDPYQIVNVGNNNPIDLIKFITLLERELGIKAIKEFHEMQLGDVKSTCADTTLIETLISYKPRTSLADGIKNFVIWYKNFYKIN